MVYEKHIPLRMCVATREMLPKSQLIRLVKTQDGIKIDDAKKISGRGVYISKSTEAFQLAKKRKVLNRAFKCNIDDSIYEKLEEYVNGNGNLIQLFIYSC